jgi:hypothetical protein
LSTTIPCGNGLGPSTTSPGLSLLVAVEGGDVDGGDGEGVGVASWAPVGAEPGPAEQPATTLAPRNEPIVRKVGRRRIPLVPLPEW